MSTINDLITSARRSAMAADLALNAAQLNQRGGQSIAADIAKADGHIAITTRAIERLKAQLAAADESAAEWPMDRNCDD